MPPDDIHDETDAQDLDVTTRQEALAQDGLTPFQPAEPTRDPDMSADDDGQAVTPLDPTHPATDTDVDLHEAYDAGTDAAAGATEPNAGNAVTGYEKPAK